MAQNIYDDPGFFHGYSQLRRSKEGLSGAPEWPAPGVLKYHRALGTLLNTLIHTGFNLRHVDEWGPTEAQLAAQPELAEERERPMMLLVSARRQTRTAP
ncbi:Methyltransferase [Myxococcus hansupus]|uniref:Methyltransferase n=1 Tax=Pseudomyxococcus hansupus TaxID=1297742 RepID=A0A0H4WPG7_9BACT|nr:hypothetical protein [Myxococcus hansupus]AKQ63230.1 Methyltransferase [Myxococcus hansupus]